MAGTTGLHLVWLETIYVENWVLTAEPCLISPVDCRNAGDRLSQLTKQRGKTMKRWIALAALVGLVAACSQPEETAERLDLGDFVLGHNVVVAPDLQKGPTSRNAEPEELIAAVQGAVASRLGKYDGDRLVHLGINIGGYALVNSNYVSVG